MSSTETSTISLPPAKHDKSSSAPPSVTIFSRVTAIPLVASVIETTDKVLAENAYSRSAYGYAKGVGAVAYGYSEPLQTRFAPLIERADGLANKSLDVVEARFPTAFKTTPEDVSEYYRVRRQSVSDYVRQRQESATKTFDDRVRAPAYSVAEGIDQSFAPIVNFFETKIHQDVEPAAANASEETKYQYQKAIALSKELRSQVYVFSNEQIKQIYEHSALLQRATETANSLNAAASSSINNAQNQIHSLSDAMLAELQKVQTSASDLSHNLQNTASSVPPHLKEFSEGVQATIKDLSDIVLQKDVTLQEKVTKIRGEVSERVTPLLESAKKSISELISKAKSAASPPSTPSEQPMVNGINGDAH